jgi:hypothetical protein
LFGVKLVIIFANCFGKKTKNQKSKQRPQRNRHPAANLVAVSANENVDGKHMTLPTRVARWFVLKPKFPIWEKIWRILQGEILAYFMTIRNVLRTFGIFCGHLVYFPRFGILYQEKSGNPAANFFPKLSTPFSHCKTETNKSFQVGGNIQQ